MVIPSNKKYNLHMSVFVSTRVQLLTKKTERETKIATPMNINIFSIFSMRKIGILTEEMRIIESKVAQKRKGCCRFSFLLEMTITILSAY